MNKKQNISDRIIRFIKLNKNYLVITCVIILATCTSVYFFNRPVTSGALIAKAEKHIQEGKVALAIKEFSKIVRLFPNSYEAHKRLGDLYLEVDEKDKAKVEYLRAIKVGNIGRYDAHSALASIYTKDGDYDFAEEIILELNEINNTSAKKEIGDFYYKWGEKLQKEDKTEAIRKLRKAHKYYKKTALSKYVKKSEKLIANLYAQIADELIKSKKINDAKEIINLSVEFKDNAIAHYKLAQIHQLDKDTENAIKHYSKAFQMNEEVGSKVPYINLLMSKAKELERNGDYLTAQLYYTKAKKLDSEIYVPEAPDRKIIFNIVSTKITENVDKDLLYPGISFKLLNIGKDPLNYINVKVKFLINEKEHFEKTVQVASVQTPLRGSAESNIISIFSDKGVKHIFEKHKFRIQVFISQEKPDKWKLFRNVNIINSRNSSVIIPE